MTKLSDSAIKRFGYITINTTSDTAIHREPIIEVDSDSRIKINFEMSGILSDTYVINSGTEITLLSDTAIFNSSYGLINIQSLTAVKEFGKVTTKISDTIILYTVTLNVTSSAAIRRDRSNIRAIFQKGRQL